MFDSKSQRINGWERRWRWSILKALIACKIKKRKMKFVEEEEENTKLN
jgi:hypothetical protein